MAISTYTDLKTEIANYYARSDLTSQLDNFIDLAEAEIQRELKGVDFQTTGTVTITTGSGNLPSGFVGMQSVMWDDGTDYKLTYLPPQLFDRMLAADTGTANYYTIIGTTIKVADDESGTLNIVYQARFTPLSGSATSNAILTNHPDVYLTGCLKYAAFYMKDFEGFAGYGAAFKIAMAQARRESQERQYAGPLEVTAS